MPLPDRAAALLTGVYGAGKTTLAAEIATVLEERGEPFGAIDLDWLRWFDVGWDDREGFAVAADNLRHVSSNYFAAGARRLVIAQSIEHRWQLDAIRSAVKAPLQVVLIEADLSAIEQRSAADPTTDRPAEISVARRWLADGTVSGFEDHAVANDRDIREVALEVLTLLGW